LDLTAMNSRGSEVPTGPRKYDVELASVWIKSSVESSYQEKAGGEIWGKKSKRVMPNETYEDKIYLRSLILTRH
jgi:hypothetical protein